MKSKGMGILILIVLLILILFILWIISQPVDEPGGQEGKVVFVSSQLHLELMDRHELQQHQL